jgi:glutamine amidotransferase/cyclase
MLYLLDYGAGNVRSLANSIRKLGYDFQWVKSPEDIEKADKLLFPGVGAFGPAMQSLQRQGYAEPLKQYIASGRPYMGICIGMQTLFETSEEAPGVAGLGVVPGEVGKFHASDPSSSSQSAIKSVPQMGWNEAKPLRSSAPSFGFQEGRHFYFVHSYRAGYDAQKHNDWALTTTQYGDEVFLSSVQKGNVFATQFHPEKSGRAGLELLRAWLSDEAVATKGDSWIVDPAQASRPEEHDGLTKRIVACLDVRSNDDGDLVVTKGESYDVREKQQAEEVGGQVRNLGKPVDLALRYYLEGADEIVFLNITSFRQCPLQDQPMLSVLSSAAASIFVPLTIGGGIKDSVDPDGSKHSAKEVADEYFRAGADKVSIGSEAVLAVEELFSRSGSRKMQDVRDEILTGKTGIEEISTAYGKQAVVVSIDPRRVYLTEGEQVDPHHAACVVHGKDGSEYEGKSWWYRCTIKGGREDRDIDVVQLAQGVERLGAGEILVNSIDQDGRSKGFDRQLIDLVRASVAIPVVASSGAGSAKHFEDILSPQPLKRMGRTVDPGGSSVEAALAAGIFHRKEVGIKEVKQSLAKAGHKIRLESTDQGAGAVVQDATERERS